MHLFGYAKDEREGQTSSDEHVGPNNRTYKKFEFYDYKGEAK
jgi:hypothetical protein